MVPPGDNLEFQASRIFRDRTQLDPLILKEAKSALRHNPGTGTAIAGEFKSMELRVLEREYIVFFRRRRNVAAFVDIFSAHDLKMIESKKKEIIIRVGKGDLQ